MGGSRRLGSSSSWFRRVVGPSICRITGAWIRARSASGTWGYVLRKRAVSKFLHANAVTLDLRAVDTFYGGLGYACDSRFHVNTYLPPQPLVGCASLLSMTQIPDATTKTKLEAEHVWQNGDLPFPFRTTWSPQFCRTHVDSGSWSWSDWCRQRCLKDESWSCALQPRRRSGGCMTEKYEMRHTFAYHRPKRIFSGLEYFQINERDGATTVQHVVHGVKIHEMSY